MLVVVGPVQVLATSPVGAETMFKELLTLLTFVMKVDMLFDPQFAISMSERTLGVRRNEVLTFSPHLHEPYSLKFLQSSVLYFLESSIV